MRIATIADIDPWLEPYRPQLEEQRQYIQRQSARLLGDQTIDSFALGHTYFGLHQTPDGWVIREWAPAATALFLLSGKTNWQDAASHQFTRKDNDIWELELPREALRHLDHYKLHLHWQGGSAERIPSYATYVLQDPTTHAYDAVVWQPAKPYQWQHKTPTLTQPALIYEAHIGMSGDREAVSSYAQFTKEVLPRIAKLGYTTVQLMAIQEHPYYGSFGYHVSNFFAASSRFGTPHDLKNLIDTAHGFGIRVIMDIVHSHAVKNETEGLSRFDGTLTQYFHDGERGTHQAWDSRVFDYGKPQVAHFLLSNIRYWLDEYQFDGFRFDGVTSMLYLNHGLEQAFGSYDDYVGANVDLDALTYLHLATSLAHTIRPDATLIAEDMSAFPGLAAPISSGGIGFDYRLSMGVPDLWIKTLKEKTDEQWNLSHLFHELTSHRPEEKTISYAESHDQALVGDKTLIFRLIDKEMYYHMQADDPDLIVERGIALHKIIRLLTASTHAGGYLTFMGNEFGHPEWIDFPREGNEWSYQYAKRQWKLVDDPNLKYQYLNSFDTALVQLVQNLREPQYHYISINDGHLLLSYMRDDYLFVYNLSPTTSYVGQPVNAAPGTYRVVLSSDAAIFGGQDRIDTSLEYTTVPGEHETTSQLKLYLPARTCLVLKRQ